MDEIDVKLFDSRLASLHPVAGRPPTRSCRSNLVHSGPKSWHNLANLSVKQTTPAEYWLGIFFFWQRYSTNGLGPHRNPLWKWMGLLFGGWSNPKPTGPQAIGWGMVYGIPYLWGQGGRTRCSKKIRTKSWVKRQKQINTETPKHRQNTRTHNPSVECKDMI